MSIFHLIKISSLIEWKSLAILCVIITSWLETKTLILIALYSSCYTYRVKSTFDFGKRWIIGFFSQGDVVEWRGYEARRWQQRRRKDPLQARRVLESVSLSLRLTNDILHSAFPKYVVSSLHGCYSRLPACVAFPFFPPPPSSSEASLEGRETEKTLASPRLPRNLKICKEERKKRSFTN